MEVKTLKKHGNAHAPSFVKNPGRKYTLPDREAEVLISAGLVEKTKIKTKPSETED